MGVILYAVTREGDVMARKYADGVGARAAADALRGDDRFVEIGLATVFERRGQK